MLPYAAAAMAAFLFVQAQPQVNETPAATRWMQIGPDRYILEIRPCGPLPQCVIEISPEGRPRPDEARK